MIAAFPWGALPRCAEVDRRLQARFARARRASLGLLDEAMTSLLEVPIRWHWSTCRRMPAPPETSGVAFHMVWPARPAAEALLVWEPAFAAACVARVLKRSQPSFIDPARGPSDALAGAAAAVFVAAWRRADAATLGQLIDARTSHFTLMHGAAWSELRARVAGVDYRGVLIVTEGWLHHETHVVSSPSTLRALGETPIALAIVGARAISTHAELSSLRVHDVWLPPAWTLGGQPFEGPVTLAHGRSERGVAAQLGQGGRVMLGRELVSVPWTEEAPMKATEHPTVEVLADVPMVVRVELGAVEMSARAWADLAPGDVLTVGRKIGESVVLRASGVEIARGEMVDVDGEIGVRILERL